jgi:hypothetical protein
MIAMANLVASYNVKWSFQPDWKILRAALIYEDSLTMISTNGKNFLRYLKENLGVVIDPHSHENFGYNYTDVAYLLDSLGVGGNTVIGGHIWDPTLPQFQNWDRFRVPVAGQMYPWASWRGNILMGSGTPNHVNDPKISGVWRPKDRYNYFVDDTSGNIDCIGQFKSDIPGISELIILYDSGAVSHDKMLTSSYHITPSSITATNGITIIESTIIQPLSALRNQNKIKLTDFTSLINDWHVLYNGKAFIYDPNNPTYLDEDDLITQSFKLFQNYPNPFNPSTKIKYAISSPQYATLKVYDVLGNEVATLVNENREAGNYEVEFSIVEMLHATPLPSGVSTKGGYASGVYFYQLRIGNFVETKKMIYLR